MSQQGDPLHFSDGVPPAQDTFLGQADPNTLTLLTLTLACASSGVSLCDKFGLTGVLLKHISTRK